MIKALSKKSLPMLIFVSMLPKFCSSSFIFICFLSFLFSVFIHVCICLCGACMDVYAEARRGHHCPSVLFSAHFFEAGSLPESGTFVFLAKLEASKTQHSPIMWVLGLELWSS